MQGGQPHPGAYGPGKGLLLSGYGLIMLLATSAQHCRPLWLKVGL
jgi:hypothetical protein